MDERQAIRIVIIDGRGKDGESTGKQPNTFRGRDAAKKAINFIEEKFPGEVKKQNKKRKAAL